MCIQRFQMVRLKSDISQIILAAVYLKVTKTNHIVLIKYMSDVN
jgi:hypothetical protein